MKKRMLMTVAALTLLISTTAWAARVIVPVPVPMPPPPPRVIIPVPPPPPRVVVPGPPVVVWPPPPPEIVIAPGPPAYWFWDDGRGSWFYYDAKHRRHFSKRHGFRGNGKHFILRDGRWEPARTAPGPRHRRR